MPFLLQPSQFVLGQAQEYAGLHTPVAWYHIDIIKHSDMWSVALHWTSHKFMNKSSVAEKFSHMARVKFLKWLIIRACQKLLVRLKMVVVVWLQVTRWCNGKAFGLAISRSRVRILLEATLRNNLRQVVYTYVPLSPSSITWYRPKGGDALRLGR